MEMILNKILPAYIFNAISNLDSNRIYELRLRNKVSINYGGVYYYLNENGLSGDINQALSLSSITIEEIVMRAAQHSIYAVNNQICEGYITLAGGYRMGISGEIIFEDDKIKTIKNFSSLNLRIPHEIIGCGEKVNKIISNLGYNCLIVSSPGMGKTTLLRDLARILGNSTPIQNILIVDERSELASCVNGKAQLDVGINTDIMSNCTKQYAFEKGIRALRPDVIITDELFGESDILAVENAIKCGVKVIASAHSNNKENLYDKKGFKECIRNKLFDCYIFLDNSYGVGSIKNIFNREYELCK